MNSVILLSAGRGERLKPLTDVCPKPLCVVKGIPIIEHHLLKLAAAGFGRIIINHAYLGGKIRRHLGSGARFGIDICYSPEPPGALETGGAIVQALSIVGKEAFLTVNADIYTEYDFKCMLSPETSQARLLLVNKPPHRAQGDFGLSPQGYLDNQGRNYVYAGIASYKPEFFADCKPGRFSITPLLRAKATAQQISGELYSGLWFDIGTKEQLDLANRS